MAHILGARRRGSLGPHQTIARTRSSVRNYRRAQQIPECHFGEQGFHCVLDSLGVEVVLGTQYWKCCDVLTVAVMYIVAVHCVQRATRLCARLDSALTTVTTRISWYM